MLESVGLVGALATVGVIVGRVLILAIALRGTEPAERPAIIDALAEFVRVSRRSPRPDHLPSVGRARGAQQGQEGRNRSAAS